MSHSLRNRDKQPRYYFPLDDSSDESPSSPVPPQHQHSTTIQSESAPNDHNQTPNSSSKSSSSKRKKNTTSESSSRHGKSLPADIHQHDRTSDKKSTTWRSLQRPSSDFVESSDDNISRHHSLDNKIPNTISSRQSKSTKTTSSSLPSSEELQRRADTLCAIHPGFRYFTHVALKKQPDLLENRLEFQLRLLNDFSALPQAQQADWDAKAAQHDTTTSKSASKPNADTSSLSSNKRYKRHIASDSDDDDAITKAHNSSSSHTAALGSLASLGALGEGNRRNSLAGTPSTPSGHHHSLTSTNAATGSLMSLTASRSQRHTASTSKHEADTTAGGTKRSRHYRDGTDDDDDDDTNNNDDDDEDYVEEKSSSSRRSRPTTAASKASPSLPSFAVGNHPSQRNGFGATRPTSLPATTPSRTRRRVAPVRLSDNASSPPPPVAQSTTTTSRKQPHSTTTTREDDLFDPEPQPAAGTSGRSGSSRRGGATAGQSTTISTTTTERGGSSASQAASSRGTTSSQRGTSVAETSPTLSPVHSYKPTSLHSYQHQPLSPRISSQNTSKMTDIPRQQQQQQPLPPPQHHLSNTTPPYTAHTDDTALHLAKIVEQAVQNALQNQHPQQTQQQQQQSYQSHQIQSPPHQPPPPQQQQPPQTSQPQQQQQQQQSYSPLPFSSPRRQGVQDWLAQSSLDRLQARYSILSEEYTVLLNDQRLLSAKYDSAKQERVLLQEQLDIAQQEVETLQPYQAFSQHCAERITEVETRLREYEKNYITLFETYSQNHLSLQHQREQLTVAEADLLQCKRMFQYIAYPFGVVVKPLLQTFEFSDDDEDDGGENDDDNQNDGNNNNNNNPKPAKKSSKQQTPVRRWAGVQYTFSNPTTNRTISFNLIRVEHLATPQDANSQPQSSLPPQATNDRSSIENAILGLHSNTIDRRQTLPATNGHLNTQHPNGNNNNNNNSGLSEFVSSSALPHNGIITGHDLSLIAQQHRFLHTNPQDNTQQQLLDASRPLCDFAGNPLPQAIAQGLLTTATNLAADSLTMGNSQLTSLFSSPCYWPEHPNWGKSYNPTVQYVYWVYVPLHVELSSSIPVPNRIDLRVKQKLSEAMLYPLFITIQRLVHESKPLFYTEKQLEDIFAKHTERQQVRLDEFTKTCQNKLSTMQQQRDAARSENLALQQRIAVLEQRQKQFEFGVKESLGEQKYKLKHAQKAARRAAMASRFNSRSSNSDNDDHDHDDDDDDDDDDSDHYAGNNNNPDDGNHHSRLKSSRSRFRHHHITASTSSSSRRPPAAQNQTSTSSKATGGGGSPSPSKFDPPLSSAALLGQLPFTMSPHPHGGHADSSIQDITPPVRSHGDSIQGRLEDPWVFTRQRRVLPPSLSSTTQQTSTQHEPHRPQQFQQQQQQQQQQHQQPHQQQSRPQQNPPLPQQPAPVSSRQATPPPQQPKQQQQLPLTIPAAITQQDQQPQAALVSQLVSGSTDNKAPTGTVQSGPPKV